MAIGQDILLEKILTRVAEYQASDAHLTVGVPPVLRVDGKLVTLTDEPVVTPDTMEAIVEKLLNEQERERLEKERSIVLTYTLSNKARFKVNVFFQKGFPSASLRYIPPQVKTITELGLPAFVENFAKLKKGLVVIAGTFGSGRTATAAALIDTVNRERSEHIITIEQPIEYMFVDNKCIIEQREVGKDTASFEQALDNIYQEDVNVVLVSEMESSSVIQQVLKVAESGRLVITCMNTDSVLRSIEKIVTSVPQDQQEQIRIQLSETLQGVVAQRLLPRIGGGSVVVAEVLTVTSAIRSVIRDGAIYQINTILQTSREDGMIPMDRALAERVKAGEVLIDDALSHASDRNNIKVMLRPMSGNL